MPDKKGLRVTARMLSGLAPFMASNGVAFESLARSCGIDPVAVDDSDAFVDFEAVLSLFEKAAQSSRNDAFGLRFAEANPLGPAGLFHYIIVNSPTVRDALISRVRYTRLVTNAYQTTFGEYDGAQCYNWYIPANLGPHAQFTDYVVMLLVGRIRIMLQRNSWLPLRVDFDHKEPLRIDEFRRALGPSLRFGRDTTSLAVDAEALAHPISSADPTLLRELKAIGQRILDLAEPSDQFVDKAARQIADTMSSGNVSIEAIASSLGVTARTMQRELRQSGTTFRELLDATRSKTAERLLTETDIPLSEIAFLLGFSELSAFSRAAKSWFGITASEARKQRNWRVQGPLKRAQNH